MNKLNTTSKKLDVFFKIAGIMLDIAAVCCLVVLGILAAGWLFKLDPDMIGTGYNEMELGFLGLRVAESYAPDAQIILAQVAVQIVLALLCLITGRMSVKCIRNILQPMIQGEPFNTAVSDNLRKLAKYSFALGVKLNFMELISRILTVEAFDLTNLLLSEKITHVTVNYNLDLSFLVVAAVFLLLSHVFRYGEQLQQLSDETL